MTDRHAQVHSLTEEENLVERHEDESKGSHPIKIRIKGRKKIGVFKPKSLVMEQMRVGGAKVGKCNVSSEMSMNGKRKNRAPRLAGVQITKPV